ncbi:MAG: hypothetical protein KA104_00155 [Candidatus Pacebacteria bacterium]|nr:hypothetical protein [Candidatus Paceibacterota bacterium]
MAEVVVLEDYRDALKTLVARAFLNSRPVLDFLDQDYIDWSAIPAISDGREDLLLCTTGDLVVGVPSGSELPLAGNLLGFEDSSQIDTSLPIIVYT